MDPLSTLSVALGSSWTSGINVYATVGFLGLFARLGWLSLPEGLQSLAHPIVFGIALFLYLVEFIADKIPAFDSLWDSIQTFIRIPAGAVLAWAAVGGVSDELKVGAALIGGGLALSSHATKSSIRASANLSPEPFSNWFLSVGEDLLVVFSVWAMVSHPYVMLGLLVVFLVFFIWFARKIFHLCKRIWKPTKTTAPTSP